MALLTAEQARTYHLLGITGTNEDTAIDEFIARAGVIIADYLGWPPTSAGGEASVESATHTFYSGRGAGRCEVLNARTLQLPVAPVTSVTTVHDDPQWDYAAADLIDSGDYVLDGENGLVLLRSDASDQFSPGVDRAVKVVCVAGYSTIPGPIEQVCGMLVRRMWDLRKHQGRSSVSAGPASASLRSIRLTDFEKVLLAPFVLMRGRAA